MTSMNGQGNARSEGQRRKEHASQVRSICDQIEQPALRPPSDQITGGLSSVGSNHLGFRYTFRALKYRNYRLFFTGQGISLIGTWMQMVAMSWLVYRLTRSAATLGIVNFAGQLPSLLLMPVAGVFADQWDRRRFMIFTQTLALVQASALALIVFLDLVQVWHLIVLSLILGIVRALDGPVRQSLVADVVDNRDDFGNAIALNSSLFNLARLIGPAIAGFLLELTSEAWCFTINALSYVAVIIALYRIVIKRTSRPQTRQPVLQGLRDGFRYVACSKPIRSLLLLICLISLVGVPYVVLLPIVASDVLAGGPSTLGFLTSAAGIGALAGGIFLASHRNAVGMERNIPGAGALFGLALIAFSRANNLPLALAFLPLTGFGMMVGLASSNTVIQTIVADEMRGRVMSFYMLSFFGAMPFGSLLAGFLAEAIGAPATIMAGGICVLAAAVLFRGIGGSRITGGESAT